MVERVFQDAARGEDTLVHRVMLAIFVAIVKRERSSHVPKH